MNTGVCYACHSERSEESLPGMVVLSWGDPPVRRSHAALAESARRYTPQNDKNYIKRLNA